MNDDGQWLGEHCVQHSEEWRVAEEALADATAARLRGSIMATDTLPPAPEDRPDWPTRAASVPPRQPAEELPADLLCVRCDRHFAPRAPQQWFGVTRSTGFCADCYATLPHALPLP